MWLICLLISHVVLAHGYFAYVNETSFAYPEHLVHGGVAKIGQMGVISNSRKKIFEKQIGTS